MNDLTKFLITTLINPPDNITHMDIQELADYGIPEEVIDYTKKRA